MGAGIAEPGRAGAAPPRPAGRGNASGRAPPPSAASPPPPASAGTGAEPPAPTAGGASPGEAGGARLPRGLRSVWNDAPPSRVRPCSAPLRLCATAAFQRQLCPAGLTQLCLLPAKQTYLVSQLLRNVPTGGGGRHGPVRPPRLGDAPTFNFTTYFNL